MTLSITEVAAATGLRPSALRYYEEAGLITPRERRSGRRFYDPAVLPRLGLVALFQQAGFTIAEIAEMFDARPGARQRWEGLANRKLGEIDDKIRSLHTMRTMLEAALRCQCGDIEACDLVSTATRRHAEDKAEAAHR